jgi:DNA-binding NarL/FixJ family response regulator
MALNCLLVTDANSDSRIHELLTTNSQVNLIGVPITPDNFKDTLGDNKCFLDLVVFDLYQMERILELVDRIGVFYPCTDRVMFYDPQAVTSWMFYGTIEQLLPLRISRHNLYEANQAIASIYSRRFISLRRLHVALNLNAEHVSILKFLQLGYTDKQIAEALGLGGRTVTNAIANLLLKFECKNRVELAVKSVLSLGQLD